MKWVGTSPGETNDSRTTLRVSCETGLARLHWGVPPASFSSITCSDGGVTLLSHSVSNEAASAALDKSCDED